MLKVSCEQKLNLKVKAKGACEEKLDSEISTGAEKNNLSKDNNEKSESESNEDLDKKCQPLCPRYEAIHKLRHLILQVRQPVLAKHSHSQIWS